MLDWEAPNHLLSLTHLDGRNAHKLTSLRPYFSEFAWMKMRLAIMEKYVETQLPHYKNSLGIAEAFTPAEAKKVVGLEKTLNHDLKALEEYMISRLPSPIASKAAPLVNFSVGSEDINNIALGRILLDVRAQVLIPGIRAVLVSLALLAKKEKNTVMPARTHGLPAGLTTFGKEIANTIIRLKDELALFSSIRLSAKFSGEVGTFHAASQSGTQRDWMAFSDSFIRSMGLVPHHGATQIVPYDTLAGYLQSIFRINAILTDLCQDMWLYVLLGYLKLQKKEEEVGSAGMPHKVNPIYFEGAEGGFIMANGIIETLVRKLPLNRLQRDFSDSTVRRNLVLPFAYSLLSYQSVVEAFSRISVDRDAIAADLHAHAEVFIEPVKAILLEAGIAGAYTLLKKYSRGRIFTADELLALTDTFSVSEEVKQKITTLVRGRGKTNPYPARIVAEALRKK